MPMPGVADGDLDVRLASRATRTSIAPARGVNLIAFESRFQTTCCSRVGSPGHLRDVAATIDARARGPSHPRRARRVSSASSTHAGEVDRLESSRSLPVMMRDTSSTSSMICACDVRVALDRLERAAGRFLGRAAPDAQHARVAKDRVQRRAQLVRQRRQKFILQPVGVLEPPIGLRIVDGERAARGHIQREPQIVVAELTR